MYQVIARKYRPASFSELIGQEHVRTTLQNAIAQRRIAHGYILAGQRGTGKTTVARILARCLNCVQGPTAEPCNVCSSCTEIAAGSSMDVIEIDAASNRGINEMRELRENVRFRPARDRYKVFIVDEAHQITSEAFNALLKTLEEPPEWVVFILCTTEVHKIPATIASRCQQFSFRSVDFVELIQRMRWICEQEGIAADDEVLSVLAQAGEGSVRDSLSALDQAIACCGATLNSQELRGLLGLFSLDALHQVTQALAESDTRSMLDIIFELERNGQSLQHFCRELARYFRNLLVANIAGKETRLIGASAAEQARLREIAGGFSEQDLTRYLQLTLDLFKDLQTSLQPRLHTELGLLKLVHVGRLKSIEDALAGMGPATVGAKQPERRATKSPAVPPELKPERPAALPAPILENDWKSKVHAALAELGANFTADAVEHSAVSERAGELQFETPHDYEMAMRVPDLQKAAQMAAGKPMRVKVTFGAPEVSGAVQTKVESAPTDDEVSRRALAHPEVQRFQQLFPDAQVRAVRNLKE